MICMWSSWCRCHPIISCFVKIKISLAFLVPAYPGCPGKEAVKRVSLYLSVFKGIASRVVLFQFHFDLSLWLQQVLVRLVEIVQDVRLAASRGCGALRRNSSEYITQPLSVFLIFRKNTPRFAINYLPLSSIDWNACFSLLWQKCGRTLVVSRHDVLFFPRDSLISFIFLDLFSRSWVIISSLSITLTALVLHLLLLSLAHQHHSRYE